MVDEMDVPVIADVGHEASTVDRRRPGRLAQVSPSLLPLLRDADRLADEAPVGEHPPRHPQGVLIQVGICAMLWGGIIQGCRMFF